MSCACALGTPWRSPVAPWFRSVAQTTSVPPVNVATSPSKLRIASSRLGSRRDRNYLPSASITTQWWCVLPASTPAHSCGILDHPLVVDRCTINDHAGMSLQGELFASLNERSSRCRIPGG